MNRLGLIAAVVLSALPFASSASAQMSVPLFTTTYAVQIEWSHWQATEPSWRTIATFDNREEAEMMLALCEVALEEDMLGEILGITGPYLIFDVRLRTVTDFNELLDDDVVMEWLRKSVDLRTLDSKTTAIKTTATKSVAKESTTLKLETAKGR